ncbi:hypothetical protein SDC9_183522 [bioreactor metagenome]|uniref:Uncharacterized protein n=1 Tax=bioreactor metagenome TaxID=1076179 RepID=A0A645HAF4_9ZZZZ
MFPAHHRFLSCTVFSLRITGASFERMCGRPSEISLCCRFAGQRGIYRRLISCRSANTTSRNSSSGAAKRRRYCATSIWWQFAKGFQRVCWRQSKEDITVPGRKSIISRPSGMNACIWSCRFVWCRGTYLRLPWRRCGESSRLFHAITE